MSENTHNCSNEQLKEYQQKTLDYLLFDEEKKILAACYRLLNYRPLENRVAFVEHLLTNALTFVQQQAALEKQRFDFNSIDLTILPQEFCAAMRIALERSHRRAWKHPLGGRTPRIAAIVERLTAAPPFTADWYLECEIIAERFKPSTVMKAVRLAYPGLAGSPAPPN